MPISNSDIASTPLPCLGGPSVLDCCAQAYATAISRAHLLFYHLHLCALPTTHGPHLDVDDQRKLGRAELCACDAHCAHGTHAHKRKKDTHCLTHYHPPLLMPPAALPALPVLGRLGQEEGTAHSLFTTGTTRLPRARTAAPPACWTRQRGVATRALSGPLTAQTV